MSELPVKTSRTQFLKFPAPPPLPFMVGPWSPAEPPQSQASGRDSSARKMPVTAEGSRTGSLEPLPVDLYSGTSESLAPDNLVLIVLLGTSWMAVGMPRWKPESWWCFLKWPLSPGKWGLRKGTLLCLKYLLGHGLVGVHFVNKNLEKHAGSK